MDQLRSEKVDFDVEPENWPIVMMFMRLQTQWRMGPSGVIGLDYNAALSVFAILKVDDPDVMLDGIQVMEFAALREMSKSE